jgi:hypothetical protein
MNMQNYNLIGKTLAEVAVILGNDFSFRVASRDGQSYGLSQDYVPDRYNLHLVDGRVTTYSKG